MTGFKLRTPCPNCPWRTDIPGYLRAERAQEIATSVARGADFPCHKTTEPDPENESENIGVEGSQTCAGALICLERMEQPNQHMRIAERLGAYDRERLDMDAPVVKDLTEFILHHAGEPEEEAEPCSISDDGCLAPAGYMEGGAVITNVDFDPEDVSECPECGTPVCDACTCYCEET